MGARKIASWKLGSQIAWAWAIAGVLARPGGGSGDGGGTGPTTPDACLDTSQRTA